MTYQLIIGIDPGTTTGWAALEPRDPARSFDCGELAAQLVAPGLALRLHLAVADGRRVLVVCERFTVTTQTARKSPQQDATKVIGAIESAVTERFDPEEVSVVQQAAAPAKRFAPTRKLKRAGMDPGPRHPHARDATRHALLALATFEGIFPFDWVDG